MRARRAGVRAVPVLLVALLVASVGGLAPVADASPSEGPRSRDPVRSSAVPAAPDAVVAPVTAKPGDRLAPRLAALAAPTAPGGTDAATLAAITGLPATGPGSLERTDGGALLVDVLVRDTGAAQQAALVAAGASITAVSPVSPRITVSVPVTALRRLATAPGVQSVDEVLAPMSNATCPTGIFDEGNTQLGVATARTAQGVDGTGVTVGVLSDSYNSLGGAPTDVANAEVPGTTNPCTNTTPVDVVADSGNTDEGRAMAQIVHDLAPQAGIAFATANGGEVAFGNNIRALRAAGARVIVDDITYFAEPMYQDGEIARAVDDVTAQGTTYVSSAANATKTIGGKSVASYEAPGYRPTPCPASAGLLGVVDCHNFNPNPAGPVDATDSVTLASGGQLLISFGWNEPLFGVTTDLDAFLLDASGTVVASSTIDNPTFSKRPWEFLAFSNPAPFTNTYRIVVGRVSGAMPRFKFVMNRSSGLSSVEWNTSNLGDVVGPTTYGHNASLAGGTIAATPYDNSAVVEPFSSQGPARYCWAPVDGATPAAALPACVTKTIDVTATDGNANSFFGGFSNGAFRFYGTSAAAPHAAAVLALGVQKQPCREPAERLAALRAAATPLPGIGPDSAGAGLVVAGGAISGLLGCAGAAPSAPTGVVAVAGRESATVSWVAPSLPGGSAVSGYTVTASPGGRQCRWSAGPLTCDVGGLTGGVPVTFTVLATNDAGPGPPSTASLPTTPWSGTQFHPLAPTRVLDSRGPTGNWNGPLLAATPRPLTLGGVAGIPASATAVIMNVTVTGSTAGSFLTVYPSGSTRPNASNLNFGVGQTIPNLVTVRLGPDGTVLFANQFGATQVVADVVGYFDDGTTTGDRFTGVTPARILDSRGPNGGWNGPIGPGDANVRNLAVAGRGGVPLTATSVVMNVTATGSDAGSFLQVWPAGANRPNSSNVNFGVGETIPNLVSVPLGVAGEVSVYNDVGHTDVVADVVGYFDPTGGSRFHPLASPTRLLDDRFGTGLAGPWGPNESRGLAVAGVGPVPTGATGLVMNTTATNGTANSFLTVYPSGDPLPVSSNVNFAVGQTIPNLVVVRLPGTGIVQIYNLLGRVDVIGDAVGYYAAS